MISTRGRYALRVLMDLAAHPGVYTPMREVAARQEISLKYIEKILPSLVSGGFVEGVHGKGGGYRLARDPSAITVYDVLLLAEGDLAPVTCLSREASPCPRAAYCKTLPMWKKYAQMTKEYFESITVSDLVNTESAGDFVI